MTERRASYHHGDLRAALIRAADEMIAEGGLEAFSLRAAAVRAGVSPGAPAHHFGNAAGLLTEVALLGYARLGEALARVPLSGDPVTDVRALTLAYVRFAVERPGHFRLMYRHDLVNRHDPRYGPTATASTLPLFAAVRRYAGGEQGEREDDDAFFLALSSAHGVAQLVLAEKAAPFFGSASPQAFMEQVLPRLLEQVYPQRGGSR